MTATSNPALSLRRGDAARLAWALVLSLLFHAFIYGLVELNKRYAFLEHVQPPAWLFPPKRLAERMAEPVAVAQPDEPPMLEILPSVYVDVNPAAVTIEPPKDTPYYSTANTQAANPNAEKDADLPKIEGTQTEVPRTETVTRPAPQPLIPAPPVAAPAPPPVAPPVAVPTPPPVAPPVAQPEPPPAPPTVVETPRAAPPVEAVKPQPAPGDLALARPDPLARPDVAPPLVISPEPPPAQPARPRSLKEAVNRLAATDPVAAAGLVGEQMKQEGGVRRRSEMISSLDVRASPFGAYDQAIIYAVQQRWYALLDAKNYTGGAAGKLALRFRLHHDGRVTELRVTEQTVDEIYSIICQRAILDNAPYSRWPPDMRRMIQEDYRDVSFTFYYR